MNKTFNYEMVNRRNFPNRYSPVRCPSATERFLEIFSYILSLVYDFVTNEAVVLISKLSIVIASFAGIFIMMGISVSGIIAFFPAFMIALGLLAVILLTFKSMFN